MHTLTLECIQCRAMKFILNHLTQHNLYTNTVLVLIIQYNNPNILHKLNQKQTTPYNSKITLESLFYRFDVHFVLL